MNSTIEIKLDLTKPENTDGSGLFRKTLNCPSVMTAGIHSLLQKQGIDQSVIAEKTQELLNHKEPLDYLQVAHIGSTKVWCIDDGAVITWLLPEEY